MSNNATQEITFKSMREASVYFNFPYSSKDNKLNNQYLSCYCDWKRISRKFIHVRKIYDTPKEILIYDRKKYQYNVGDIISSTNSSFKVLKQIRCERKRKVHENTEIVYEKGYLVKCIKDGYEFEILEQNISRNFGCPVCSNRKVIKGINDVATTHPDIARLFENIEDAYTTSFSTSKKFRFKCPRCGNIKLDSTNNISFFGFSCPNCSDGVSYPNKFMYKLLSVLHIDFDREVKFDWCKYPCFVDKDKLDYGNYDFVIPKMHLIIEMDGGLGHGNRVMSTISHNRRKISLEETVYRDKMKDVLAKENGFNVIRINCDYSSDVEERFKTVMKNIMKSPLSNIFNLNEVNFKEIDEFCLTNSYIVDIAKLWNDGLPVSKIEKEMKLSSVTVGKYLKTCSKLGLCDYSKEKSINRSLSKTNKRSPYLVYYNDIIQVFSSFSEMQRFYVKNYNIKLCRGTVLRYIDNNKTYLNRTFHRITKEEFNKYHNNKSLANLVIGEAFLIAA